MEIKDIVYGNIKINDKVLIELIKSKPIQRLKGIKQAGATPYAIKNRNTTRYEHSIGVMLLLKKLNASLEEQIAGLMHDIPHTAFSHVVDFVFLDKKHEFHEKFHKQIINNSEIPFILKKHGLNIKRLTNEDNFPLLEKNLPDLCADRIDYTLRDMVVYSGRSKMVDVYLSSFIVKNNEIIIKDGPAARSFAEYYLKADELLWSNPLEVALYQILADAIKIGLKEKIISKKDLFQDDDFVYGKLKSSKNKEISKKLSMLNPNIRLIEDSNDYHFYTKNKLRYIDPKFLDANGSIRRVSEIYPKFKEILEKHRKRMERGYFVKIIPP